MVLVLTAAAFILLGWIIVARVWPRDADVPAGGLERFAAALLIGTTFWVASLWAIALSGFLTSTVVLVRTFAVALIVLILGTRHWRDLNYPSRHRLSDSANVPAVVVLLLIAAWTLFVCWRGWVLPPLTHDALSYHLPRAVLLIREQGWTYFGYVTDWRLSDLPANYELLLADALLLEGDDQISEWLSAIFYVQFLVTTGALVRRWWPAIPLALSSVIIFAAGIPVLLLHTGAHKNDLMTAVFMLQVILWSGRYFTVGELRALILAILGGALAIGTKPQPVMLIMAVTPLIIARLVFQIRKRQVEGAQLVRIVMIAVVAFALLGGYAYGTAVVERDHPPSLVEDPTATRYGEWRNLWEAPYVLLVGPFAPNPTQLPVPWSERPWFWQRYEIFFSHLGIPFVIAVALLPAAAAAAGKLEGQRRERSWMLFAAGAALLAIFPVEYDPHGFYTISLPRYALYIAAVVFAWAIPPLLFAAGTRSRLAGPLIVYAGCASFVFYGIDMAANDRFAPFDHVLTARKHPGTRYIPFEPFRATSVADLLAEPRDLVAIDAGYGTWIHPLFGSDLQRPVYFIPEGRHPPSIPADVEWVVVERMFNIVWRHPDLTDLSRAYGLLLRGEPHPEDLRVLRYMRTREDFELVFYNPPLNQAIFRRKPPEPPP